MICTVAIAAPREPGLTPWSEEALRKRLQDRATQLGMTMRALLERAGIDKSNFYRGPARRIDTLLKLAEACEWDLAQVLGVGPHAETVTDPDLLLLAYRGAERYLAALPAAARTPKLLAESQAQIYDLLAARQRRGETIDIRLVTEWAVLMASVWHRQGSH